MNKRCHHETDSPLKGSPSHRCAVELFAYAIGVASTAIFRSAEINPSG